MTGWRAEIERDVLKRQVRISVHEPDGKIHIEAWAEDAWAALEQAVIDSLPKPVDTMPSIDDLKAAAFLPGKPGVLNRPTFSMDLGYGDPEVDMLAVCTRALGNLDERARNRALRYLTARFTPTEHTIGETRG